MKTLKTLATGVVASVALMGIASTANATVVAYSTLQISNLRILENQQNLNTTFYQNSSETMAQLNGVTVSQNPTYAPVIPGNPAFPPLPVYDTAQSYVGGGFVAENDFSRYSATSNAQFARGDALLSGSFLDPVNGAAASTVAETQISSYNSQSRGSSNVDLGATFQWVFNTEADSITFGFDALMEALVSIDQTNGASFGRAVSQWNIRVTDTVTGNEIFAQSPSDINTTLFSSTVGQVSDSHAGSYIYTVENLVAGRNYELSISHTTRVDAFNDVPVPAALSLLGVGLIGLAGLASRRRKSA